eukprot:gnl/MRDRNA2_/MRDRNA2_45691_c0_seq1.p1 gnl/MRDRNA2_/MRDRNA2_45691_c0~~gnl/MRDRNA2_/MRDRNA2_45691_c0_seq1.p1  ORF type:complete len:150 (+),score=16.31 gnl/MRDRNA2_/MRDRNA2_45691_c0_seq1:94-543(+)
MGRSRSRSRRGGRNRSRSRRRDDSRSRRKRSPSRKRSASRKKKSRSSSSSPRPAKKAPRLGGFGDAPQDHKAPVEKVGAYKLIDDEKKRREACGEPPMDPAEVDLIFRNFTRQQQGLPPLTAADLQGDPIKGGKGKGKDKGKGKGKGKW